MKKTTYKKVLAYSVIISLAIVAIAALILVAKYFAGFLATCALVLWWWYEHTQEKKQMQQQNQEQHIRLTYYTAAQLIFTAAPKYAATSLYLPPQVVEDVMVDPPIVYINDIPFFQYRLVKTQTTTTPNAQSCKRLQHLLQIDINNQLRSGMVPNIPGFFWNDSNGYKWPIFTIVAVREDPLYYGILVALIDNEQTASFLYQKKFAKRSPQSTSANDPDY